MAEHHLENERMKANSDVEARCALEASISR
jgi:hypothetical protein